MAFAFGSPPPFGGASANSGSAQTQNGPDLEEISTDVTLPVSQKVEKMG